MSTTLSSTSTALAAAETAAKAASASAASASASSGSGSAASATSSSALSSLTSNFNEFLTLLTTQLQNQDPTSPMDSDTFTSELAEFAGVEQQVNTNTNLSTLISLNQDSDITQGTSLVGKQAVATTNQIPLQNGSGEIQFTTSSPENVAIAVTDGNGNVVKTATVTSSAGTNTWNWDGTDNSGTTLPNGTYGIDVETSDSSGNVSAVPFSVISTISGVSKNASGGVSVQLGSETVDMGSVSSVSTAGQSASAS